MTRKRIEGDKVITIELKTSADFCGEIDAHFKEIGGLIRKASEKALEYGYTGVAAILESQAKGFEEPCKVPPFKELPLLKEGCDYD